MGFSTEFSKIFINPSEMDINQIRYFSFSSPELRPGPGRIWRVATQKHLQCDVNAVSKHTLADFSFSFTKNANAQIYTHKRRGERVPQL